MGVARKHAPSSCPVCGKPAVPGAVLNAKGGDAFPFCSFRCQLVDLGRWLGEEYRVPDGPDQSGGGVDGVPAPGDEPGES